MPDARLPAIGDVRFPTFAPRAPWFGGDLQTLCNTIRAALGRPVPDLSIYPAERLSFVMRDGSGDTLVATLNRPLHAIPAKPVVLLIHGLTGCEASFYILNSAAALLAAGYPVLRLNLRGAGPSRPTCKLHYHAGRSGDIEAVLRALPLRLSGDGVFVVGYSLGGNMLLKYLGEAGDQALVRAAASISAPIDLKAAQLCLMRRRNAGYQHYILARMRAEILSAGAAIDDGCRRLLGDLRTVYEFDDRFVAPRNGFDSAEDYYLRSSSRPLLPAIRKPTLVIHGLNDPWIPADAYLTVDWNANSCLRPLLPDGGGHVGFHGQGGPPAWHDQCLTAFFDSLS